MTNIEGTWASTYTYGQGPDNVPQTSEHTIVFEPCARGWAGQSLPAEDGSHVSFYLEEESDRIGEFRGEWLERTAPEGSYKGREFDGWLHLILNGEGELNGVWTGASSDNRVVKSGSWTFRRQPSEQTGEGK